MATSVTKEETETLSLSPSAEILWKWPEAEIRWQRGSNQCSLVAFASLWAQKQVNVARKAISLILSLEDFSLSWLMIRLKLSLHTCSHTLRALTDSMVERRSGSEALQVTLDGLPDVTHKIRLSLRLLYLFEELLTPLVLGHPYRFLILHPHLQTHLFFPFNTVWLKYFERIWHYLSPS